MVVGMLGGDVSGIEDEVDEVLWGGLKNMKRIVRFHNTHMYRHTHISQHIIQMSVR